MNRENAQLLSLLAQLIGLIWIPGVAFIAASRGASRTICLGLSWGVAVLWGIGFCLVLAAWSFEVTPGWDLFPEGPGAIVFLLFGWVGGFIGHAMVWRRIPDKWVVILPAVSAVIMGACLLGVSSIGKAALLQVQNAEFPTKNCGTICKRAEGKIANSRSYDVIISHRESVGDEPTQLGRVRESARELGSRPEMWEADGLLAVQWKEGLDQVLALRSVAGQWQVLRLDDRAFNRWPNWASERNARFKNTYSYITLDQVDLPNRVIKCIYHMRGGIPVTLSLSPNGDALNLEKVEWPPVVQ